MKMNVLEGKYAGEGLKIGIVASRFNEFITTKLIGGAEDCLKRHGVKESDITLAWVPGAFEIPVVAKKIAESDIRDILKAKKTDISIKPMWVSFCSCGTDVEVDKLKLINGNVYLSGKFPSGKEVDKPFSEIWDIHNLADICKEIGV